FGLASIPVDRSRRVSWPYPLRTVLHLVRFNNSYRIRHFCNARVLNSLHFLNGSSAGFLRTLAASRPPRYATTRGPYRRDHEPGGGRTLRGMRSFGPTAVSTSIISRVSLRLDNSFLGCCPPGAGSAAGSAFTSTRCALPTA